MTCMERKMTHIANLAAWLWGAAGAMLAYWYVVIYLFDQFNHGYGRDTWFVLNLYVSALYIAIGLLGCALANYFWARPRTVAFACLAGIAFSVVEVLLVLALERAFPDRDIIMQGLVGAFVIGALSAFVICPHAS